MNRAEAQAGVEDEHALRRIRTLVELLRWRAERCPDATAHVLVDDGQRAGEPLTYGALHAQACAIAGRLQRTQAPGSRALLMYAAGHEFLAALFGCFYAGVIAVPLPRPARLAEGMKRIAAVVADAQPSALLGTRELIADIDALLDRPTSDPVIAQIAALERLASDDVASAPSGDWRPGRVRSQQIAYLQYTSGSTSAPKGVVLTHANLLENLAFIWKRFGFDLPGQALGTWLPLFHDMGLVGDRLTPIYAGAPIYEMATRAFLRRPVDWLRLISRYGVTVSGCPNFGYEMCIERATDDELAELDLGGWRVAYNGAEPVRRETLERFARRFAPSRFQSSALYPCYGLAEATLLVAGGATGAPPSYRAVRASALERDRVEGAEHDDADVRQLVACGWGPDDGRIEIVDPETHERCAPDRVGEIWVSAPGNAIGYWNRTLESHATFAAELPDVPGARFLRTGDLGFLHDGQLYITGRIKDVIVLRGRNIYPHDIEETVETSHRALRRGCSVAFSVDDAGEERLVVLAELSPREGVVPEADEIVAAVRRAVSYEHQLQVSHVVLSPPGTILKTTSGKVQRQACRAFYLSGKIKGIV